MNITRTTIALAATTGDITAATPGEITGQILSIHLQYLSAATTGFATTAGIAVISNVSSQTVWAETLSVLATAAVTVTRVPRQVTHSTVGVALTSTSGLVGEPICIVNEKLIITCTSVGSGTKAATLIIHSG